jgi:hypothetical protein
MRTWMLPFLFPVGLLGAVVFTVVTSPYEAFAAVGLGVVLVPILWRLNVRPDGDETKYWRINRR